VELADKNCKTAIVKPILNAIKENAHMNQDMKFQPIETKREDILKMKNTVSGA
jgi:hypothetical protein